MEKAFNAAVLRKGESIGTPTDEEVKELLEVPVNFHMIYPSQSSTWLSATRSTTPREQFFSFFC